MNLLSLDSHVHFFVSTFGRRVGEVPALGAGVSLREALGCFPRSNSASVEEKSHSVVACKDLRKGIAIAKDCWSRGLTEVVFPPMMAVVVLIIRSGHIDGQGWLAKWGCFVLTVFCGDSLPFLIVMDPCSGFFRTFNLNLHQLHLQHQQPICPPTPSLSKALSEISKVIQFTF
jgi:hypothetical protein